MLDKSQLVQALKEGDVDILNAPNVADVYQRVLAEPQMQVALMRSAERVVFHRPNYRAAVRRAIELGIPCDIWTAARAPGLFIM